TALNIAAPINIHATIPVILPDSFIASFVFNQLSLLVRTDIKIVPITPTAAPSVGVATPAKIEPKTITIRIKGKMTALKASNFSLNDTRSSFNNAGAFLGSLYAINNMYSIKSVIKSNPALKPPANKLDTDTPVIAPYTTIFRLGGIS